LMVCCYMIAQPSISFTYDHRTLKTGLPVRSALLKQRTGGLVVRWVTTSEYPLLYVFLHFVDVVYGRWSNVCSGNEFLVQRS
jgi:hypothetical protein